MNSTTQSIVGSIIIAFGQEAKILRIVEQPQLRYYLDRNLAVPGEATPRNYVSPLEIQDYLQA